MEDDVALNKVDHLVGLNRALNEDRSIWWLQFLERMDEMPKLDEATKAKFEQHVRDKAKHVKHKKDTVRAVVEGLIDNMKEARASVDASMSSQELLDFYDEVTAHGIANLEAIYTLAGC